MCLNSNTVSLIATAGFELAVPVLVRSSLLNHALSHGHDPCTKTCLRAQGSNCATVLLQ